MGTPIQALPDLANLPPVRRGSRGQIDLLLPARTSRQDRGRVAGRRQGTDKAQMGDVFYQSVGARADALVEHVPHLCLVCALSTTSNATTILSACSGGKKQINLTATPSTNGWEVRQIG